MTTMATKHRYWSLYCANTMQFTFPFPRVVGRTVTRVITYIVKNTFAISGWPILGL